MKKSIGFIFVFMFAAIYIMSVTMFINIKSSEKNLDNNVTLEFDGDSKQTLNIETDNMVPGNSIDYTLNLGNKVEGDFNVNFDFEEISDDGISSFIEITISNDEVTVTKTLSELLEEEKIDFDCDFKKNQDNVYYVKFYMPLNVGNEAQGTSGNFNLVVTVSHK